MVYVHELFVGVDEPRFHEVLGADSEALRRQPEVVPIAVRYELLLRFWYARIAIRISLRRRRLVLILHFNLNRYQQVQTIVRFIHDGHILTAILIDVLLFIFFWIKMKRQSNRFDKEIEK